jgi:hypothetical protein
MYVKSDRPNGTSRQYYPMLQRTKLHILELNDKNGILLAQIRFGKVFRILPDNFERYGKCRCSSHRVVELTELFPRLSDNFERCGRCFYNSHSIVELVGLFDRLSDKFGRRGRCLYNSHSAVCCYISTLIKSHLSIRAYLYVKPAP